MIDYDNLRYPIVIISTPRSGSTALLLHIHRHIGNIPCYIEPEQSEETLNEFLSHIENNTNYIVKIHIDNFSRYPERVAQYLLHSRQPYRILIERRNQIKQLVSFYIEKHRNKWTYIEGDAFKQDIIPIDIRMMKNLIDFYNQQNGLLAKDNIKYDTVLTYEDCVFENTGTRKTPQPKNYQELYNTFTTLLEGNIK